VSNNIVTVDESKSPAEITYSDVFNVAIPFIDRHISEGRRDEVAVSVHGGGDVTYETLAKHVNKSGNALLTLGLQRGDRLLMIVKDGIEFYYIFWGAIKAGIIPVPLNTLLRAKDYSYMIENSEASCVIYSSDYSKEVETAVENSSHKPKINLLTDGDGDTLAKYMNTASSDLSPAKTRPEDDCFWLYSSGTTGGPKGVVHAHKDMVVTSQHYGIGILGINNNDVCFSAAKLFFAYGLGNAMTFPLWAGARAVLFSGPPTPDICHEIIEKYKPTIFYGVPTLYAAQLKSMENNLDHVPDLSSIRVCTSAGEALPPDLLKRWIDKTGIPLLDGIGTTEILHIFLSNQIDNVQPGASGLPVPGYQAKIVDDDGKEVKTGETGSLMITGDSLLKHYWRNPDKTRESIQNGWMYTGDTYYKDAKGFYFCCGRSDDMLKVGGIWCSPVEIENALVEHPKVLEAAIVGREDNEQLIKPEAFVVLNNTQDASELLKNELLEHCKNTLARYKYPRWFNFVDDLPKTATGKIQRFKLRRE